MISPWQGLAQMAQTFVNARQESSAADQLAAGRQQLAQAISGIDPNTGTVAPEALATAMRLDPDTGLKLLQTSIEARRAERERQQHLDDIQQQREWTLLDEKTRRGEVLSDAERERKQQLDDIKSGYTHEAEVNTRELGEAQAATKASQDFSAAEAEKARQATIEAAKLKAAEPDSPEGKIMSDFNAGRYGDPTSPEAIALRDAAIKKETQPSGVGGPANLKILYDQQDQYIGTSSAIGQLGRAKALLDQGINTGYSSGVRTMAGNAGLTGEAEKAAADRTKEYNSIMTGEAITAMSQSLKGATTDTEMARFIEIMNDPTIDPLIKARQINTMMAKARAFNEQQAARLKQMDPNGELPTVRSAVTPDAEAGLLAEARKAIAAGADATLVKKRLADKGVDAGKL